FRHLCNGGMCNYWPTDPDIPDSSWLASPRSQIGSHAGGDLLSFGDYSDCREIMESTCVAAARERNTPQDRFLMPPQRSQPTVPDRGATIVEKLPTPSS